MMFDPNAPCALCGFPVGSLSMGGPSICPACDCGGPKLRYEAEYYRLEAENEQLKSRLSNTEESRDYYINTLERARAAHAGDFEAIVQLKTKIMELGLKLRAQVEVVDEMSYHGEGLICALCGGRGSRAGFKTGVGDEPVDHKPICLISTDWGDQ